MCVKSCLCNRCYKRKTCVDCEAFKYQKNDDPHCIVGVTTCEYFVPHPPVVGAAKAEV